MLGIGQMYRQTKKITSYGIQGYHVQNKYEGAEKNVKQKNKENKKNDKKLDLKKGSYIDDYTKAHQYIPGPGVYNFDKKKEDSVQPKKVSKKNITKKTFLDDIIDREKKQKRPAPGQYKLFKDDKQIKEEKKKLANRKISRPERCTYLDAVQYQASIIPGVGAYNTKVERPKSASMAIRKSRPDIPNSNTIIMKKRKNKTPDMATYHPQLNLDKKSFSRKKKDYHEWGRIERFKSEKSSGKLGPGTYLPIGQNKFVQRKAFKSVYHN